MEIEGEDGSTTQLKEGSEVVFGRGNGFNSDDPTVSRRHILFQLNPPRVSFQAIGKNPIWVRAKEGGGIKAFRRFERGELSDGDLFCVSSNNPVWFSIKKVDDDETEIMESSSDEEMKLSDKLELEVSSESQLTGNVQDLDLGFDSIDVSNIDPVKEFGFLIIGHEFDNYPKGKVRDVKSWNWFLEDHGEASTDDEDDTNHGKGKKKASSRKRKKKNDKDEDEDDEEWTGEGEEEETIAKSTGLNASKYSIRSKDLRKGKQKKGSSTQRGSAEKRSKRADEEEEEDEEEEGDETLGGFIVGDDDVEGEDEDDDDEDEFDEDEFEE